MIMTLYTGGYGRWPTPQRLQRLIRVLKQAGVTMLVDIRHSPCPSNQDPNNPYGPRPWHLLDGGLQEGITLFRDAELTGADDLASFRVTSRAGRT